MRRWAPVRVDENFRDPLSGDREPKDSFIIYFHGAQAEEKIRRLCQLFQATIPVDNTVINNKREREKARDNALQEIESLNQLIKSTETQKLAVLKKFYRVVRHLH